LEFEITNAGNTLTGSDFNGAEVLLKLVLTDGPSTEIIRQFKYVAERTDPLYQKIKFSCKDLIATLIEGDWPNEPYIDDIFSPYADDLMPNDGPAYCVPQPFGQCYIPLKVISTGDYLKGYCLGSDDYTFTVSELTSPRSLGARDVWESTDAIFRVTTKYDRLTLQTYKILLPYLLVLRGDDYTGVHDGGDDAATLSDSTASFTNDELIGMRVINSTDGSAAYITDNTTTTIVGTLSGGTDNNWDDDDAYAVQSSGIWVVNGRYQEILAKFTRSDTLSITAPGDVVEFFLEDIGVPSNDIMSNAVTNMVYAGWGLAFNGAFYYKRPRAKILAELLNSCHSVLDIDSTVQLRVKSKTSQKTLTNADILSGTFKNTYLQPSEFDSGMISFQESGMPQDVFQKLSVPAKDAKHNTSKEILSIPFVQDSQVAQAIGTLYYQRKLLKKTRHTFSTKSTCLALQPQDTITINHANYGGSFDVVVERMTIKSNGSIDFTVVRYSEDLDDFDDLSPSSVTINDHLGKQHSFDQVFTAGPDPVPPGSGYGPNMLPGRLRIGESTTNCLYADSYEAYLSVIVGGNTKARLGNLNGLLDYSTDVYGFACSKDANTYVAIDPTNGVRISASNASAITIKSGGDIDIESGGDINMKAVSGDGGTSDINFVCNSRTYTLRGGYDQDTLCLISDTDGSGTVYIGYDIDTSTPKRPASINLSSNVTFMADAREDSTHFCRIYMARDTNDSAITIGGMSGTGNYASIYLYSDTSANKYIKITGNSFYPDIDSSTTSGLAAHCWSDVFSDVITIHEVGSSPTPVTDYGKLYTKSDNLLYFCDGAGTEYTVDITGV